MKKIALYGIFIAFHLMMATPVQAQQKTDDKRPFIGYISNDEYHIYIRMNFYENNVIVPSQEIFGELPGFLGAERDSRKWLFTSTEIIDPNKAKIEIINDYGSEDLVGILTCDNDSTFTLRQKEGSTIKIAIKGKWVKIPSKITFKR